jgi:hypothetical protein
MQLSLARRLALLRRRLLGHALLQLARLLLALVLRQLLLRLYLPHTAATEVAHGVEVLGDAAVAAHGAQDGAKAALAAAEAQPAIQRRAAAQGAAADAAHAGERLGIVAQQAAGVGEELLGRGDAGARLWRGGQGGRARGAWRSIPGAGAGRRHPAPGTHLHRGFQGPHHVVPLQVERQRGCRRPGRAQKQLHG